MELFLPDHIDQAIRKLSFGLPEEGPVVEIPQLLNGTVLVGGKRLRPALCLMMGGVLGIAPERLLPYARAAELTHAASLAHDDVIDEADLRRERATLNAAASNTRAVLAGDLLLARVMVEVAGVGPLPVIQDLARAVEDLVRGEWLQDGVRGRVTAEREVLDEIARLKTGSLLRWSAMVPARLAGLPETRVQACARLGEAIGMAFQWVDDVLDFEEGAGKGVAQDLAKGLVNSVTLELLADEPALMIPVGQILAKGRPATEWPWTQAQLETAQAKVRDRAGQQLEEAGRILEELVGPQSDADCVASFRFLFEHLCARKR